MSRSLVTLPFAFFLALDPGSGMAADDGPGVTLGPQVSVAHPLLYHFPDSIFPFLPDGSGKSNMMFWTDGITYRTFGPTLSRQGPAVPKEAIAVGGPKGCFDGNGIWMLVIHRRSARDLLAFAHTENHQFVEPGRHAEWNYTALLTSADNGASWARQGPVVYRPQPKKPAFGGAGFVSAIYEPDKGRWLAWSGWGSNTVFVSSDRDASPGTWYGWRNGAFVEPGINCQRTSRLPGMHGGTASIAVHFNSYWRLYVMVFHTWGNGNIQLATSADGLSWSAPATVATFPAGSAASYPQIVGASNTSASQEATLTYSYTGHKFMTQSIQFRAGVPRPPTSLVARSGDGQVSLAWLGSLGATGYEVRRAVGSGRTFTPVASGVTSTSYMDTQVDDGTTYHYVVAAVNAAGKSGASGQVSATPVRPTAPPAEPVGLEATPGNAEVALGWTASPTAADYQVSRAAAKDGPYHPVARVAVPAYRDSGLKNDTTYFYVVAGINAAGTGTRSKPVAAKPFLPIPAVPAGMQVTPAGRALKVSWRASEVAVRYQVERATTQGGPYAVVAKDFAANVFTDAGVEPGRRYFYMVRAGNYFGYSTASEPAAGIAAR